ncbi:MAG: hypothetical protein GKR93_04910 [Gammaproteobacteria bacterium]|nr:hypothetical protein [Gammaproteobacteria bacterium]
MSRDPFSDLYEPESYVSTPELQQRLELSKHLLEFSHQLLLIRGFARVGKTVFGKHLVENADDDWLICQLEGNESIGPDQIVKSMLQAHPDILENESETIASLDRYLEYCQLNSKVPVLIVNDAHLLERKSIKFILQLIEFRYKETFVRAVLIAEDNFLAVLNEIAEEQSKTNLVHSITIPPFNLQQTEDYINHRLLASGGETKQLSKKEIGRIFKVSAGIAGDISFLAKQGLSDPAQLGGSNIKEQGVSSHTEKSKQLFMLIFAAAALTVLIGLFFMKSEYETSSESKVFNVALPPAKMTSGSTEEANDSQPAEDYQINSGSPPPEVERTQVSSSILDDKSASAKAVKKVASAPASRNSIAAYKTSDKTISNGMIQPDEMSLKADSWLLAQAESSYVLQLIGATEMSTISRFIEEAKLNQQELALYKTSKTGQDWYVLVYGNYPNLPMARAAAKDLPARAQAESPWAKSMLVIHKALKTQ